DRDARTVIANAQLDRRAATKLDPDLLSVGGRADGVVEQDPEDPRDASGVAERPHLRHAGLERGGDSALGGPELELGQHGPTQLTELDRLGTERDLGVDPREVEQV